MKWPNTVTVVRHGESAYNILKAQKEEDPTYQEFKAAYNRRAANPETARKLADALITGGQFSLGTGDHGTILTPRGEWQAEMTGNELQHRIEKPDVILVSPYRRTRETLGKMAVGWPELADVKTVEDERVREQEHGLALLYSDWRIFNVKHPEQDKLRQLEGPYWYRYPQGESVPDVRARWGSMLGTFTREYAGKNIMIVTHHLSILALRANLERLDANQFLALDRHEKPINCGVTIYRGNPAAGEDGHLDLDIYNQQLY